MSIFGDKAVAEPTHDDNVDALVDAVKRVIELELQEPSAMLRAPEVYQEKMRGLVDERNRAFTQLRAAYKPFKGK